MSGRSPPRLVSLFDLHGRALVQPREVPEGQHWGKRGYGGGAVLAPTFLAPEEGLRGGKCPGARRGTVAVPAPNPRVLTCQTVQALDDMLQALVMDGLEPDMAMLQRVLEVSGREPRARVAEGRREQ